MSKHPSLIQAAIRRLDGVRAYGVSRYALKLEQREELRAEGQPLSWSHSTGRIHSVGTADTYQRQVLAYCSWARETSAVRTLAKLDASAPELAAEWLQSHMPPAKVPTWCSCSAPPGGCSTRTARSARTWRSRAADARRSGAAAATRPTRTG